VSIGGFIRKPGEPGHIEDFFFPLSFHGTLGHLAFVRERFFERECEANGQAQVVARPALLGDAHDRPDHADAPQRPLFLPDGTDTVAVVMVCRPQAKVQPEAKEVKWCQEGALRTPCHKVITQVPNDEVKKASTAVASIKSSCQGWQ
jgi:hypothetical protein